MKVQWRRALCCTRGQHEGMARLPSTATETLHQAMREAQRPCARESVWENREPGCSLVATTPSLYPQSVLPYAKPGSLPDTPSSRYLFYPSRYAYAEGVYTGQLMVLADRGTASSAEYFAAMLRDNGAATIIGEPTAGAGCGHTNRGIPTVLSNSGARVKIPDCVRLRADGSNEVAGITPDVLVPWRRNDSQYQRVKRVFDVLSQTLGAGSTQCVRGLERAVQSSHAPDAASARFSSGRTGAGVHAFRPAWGGDWGCAVGRSRPPPLNLEALGGCPEVAQAVLESYFIRADQTILVL